MLFGTGSYELLRAYKTSFYCRSSCGLFPTPLNIRSSWYLFGCQEPVRLLVLSFLFSRDLRLLLRRNMFLLVQSSLHRFSMITVSKWAERHFDMTTQQHEMPVLSSSTFPSTAVVKRNVLKYKKGARIFTQGDSSKHIIFIEQGGVRLSLVNEAGKEAVIGILGPGDFLGESCLSGLPFRMATATAIVGSTVLAIEKRAMIRALHAERMFCDRFISFMLSKNIRVEEDLIDQLFNSTEKRLARTLLLLGRHGKQGQLQKALPKISQEVLAGMVGTTRSRVNVFMNKFRRLGFIEYKDTIRINNSLLSVVLHD